MRVATRERGNGTSVTGQSPDRAALRRPSPVAIDTKGRQPQRPVLVPAPPLTVTLTRLKPDACGTLAPQASGARAGWARDRSKTSRSRDLDDSRLGSRRDARRTSRLDGIEPPLRRRGYDTYRKRNEQPTDTHLAGDGQEARELRT